MMNQKEIFKKVGGILSELNDQYEYLSRSQENLNDLELELFSANANFLSDHIHILVKLSGDTASKPAVQPSPAPAAASPADETEDILTGKAATESDVAEEETETADEPENKPEPEDDEASEEVPSPDEDKSFAEETSSDDQEPAEIEESGEDEVQEEPEAEDKDPADEDAEDAPEQVEQEEADTAEEPESEPQPIQPTPQHEESSANAGTSEEKVQNSAEEDAVVKEVVVPERTVAIPVEQPAASESPAPTLNDIFSRSMGQQTVSSQFSSRQGKDLKSMINLNDKLLFVRDLFNGYSLAYSEAIELLNRFDSFESADNFLKQNYSAKNNWGNKPEVADKFYEILNRRFSK